MDECTGNSVRSPGLSLDLNKVSRVADVFDEDVFDEDVLSVIFDYLRPVDCRAFLYVSKRHSILFKRITSKPCMWHMKGMKRIESLVSRYIGHIILTSHQMHILNKILTRGPGTYYVHDQYLIMSLTVHFLSILNPELVGKDVSMTHPKKLFYKHQRLIKGFLCPESEEEEDPFASGEDTEEEEDIDILQYTKNKQNNDVELFITDSVIETDPGKGILVKERFDKYDAPSYQAYPCCISEKTRFSVRSRMNETSANTILLEILNHFPGETVIISETRKIDFLLDLHKIDRTRVKLYQPDTEYTEVKNIILLNNLEDKLSTMLTPGLRSLEVRVFNINKYSECFLSYIVMSTMLRPTKREEYINDFKNMIKNIVNPLDVLDWNMWTILMSWMDRDVSVDNDTLNNLKRRLGSVCYVDHITYVSDMKPILVCS